MTLNESCGGRLHEIAASVNKRMRQMLPVVRTAMLIAAFQLSSISADAASISRPWCNVTLGTGSATNIIFGLVEAGLACRRSSEHGASCTLTPAPFRMGRNEDGLGFLYGDER